MHWESSGTSAVMGRMWLTFIWWQHIAWWTFWCRGCSARQKQQHWGDWRARSWNQKVKPITEEIRCRDGSRREMKTLSAGRAGKRSIVILANTHRNATEGEQLGPTTRRGCNPSTDKSPVILWILLVGGDRGIAFPTMTVLIGVVQAGGTSGDLWQTRRTKAALCRYRPSLPAPDRDALLRQARQMNVADHLREWLSSPGLLPPKKKLPTLGASSACPMGKWSASSRYLVRWHGAPNGRRVVRTFNAKSHFAVPCELPL